MELDAREDVCCQKKKRYHTHDTPASERMGWTEKAG
jgi:hypothetical protein